MTDLTQGEILVFKAIFLPVAALALFLCSDESGFITGCDYPIDGGFIKLNN